LISFPLSTEIFMVPVRVVVDVVVDDDDILG
jgi:hypothetical protein